MGQNTNNKVLNKIGERNEEIIHFLQKLIQIDSITGGENQIQDFIQRYLSEINLEVDAFEPDIQALREEPGFVEPEISMDGRQNVVGVWRGKGDGRSLVLNGHVDTIPVDPKDQWVDGPFSGAVHDDKVWGRGASDMKSGLAAMTMAVRILKEEGYQPEGDVILQYVVDEERTGIGTLACVQKGYTADAGICCETSDLQVMPACIGRMWFTISLRGKPAGISARWEGVSAIDKAMKIVQAVDDLEKIRINDLHHPLYPDNRGALPCAVTMVDSGSFPSQVPERATLRGSMGLMPYETISEAKTQLENQIHNVSQADPWLRNNKPDVSIEGGYLASGAEIPGDHPIVKTVSNSYLSTTGTKAAIRGRMGAADTRFLINNGQTPTVIFGPGLTAQMHAMNEHVLIENLIIATKVIALSIMDWCVE